MGTYSSDNAMAGIWRAIIMGPADKEDTPQETPSSLESSDIQDSLTGVDIDGDGSSFDDMPSSSSSIDLSIYFKRNYADKFRIYIPALHKDQIPFDMDSTYSDEAAEAVDKLQDDSTQPPEDLSTVKQAGARESTEALDVDEETVTNDGQEENSEHTGIQLLETDDEGYFIKDGKRRTILRKSDYPVAPMCSWAFKMPLQVGDPVWIMFENGNSNYPVILGQFASTLPTAEEFFSQLLSASSGTSSNFLNDGDYPLGSVCYAFETGGQVLGQRNCWMNKTLNDGANQNYGMMSANRGQAKNMIKFIKEKSPNFNSQIGSKAVFSSEFNAWWKGPHSDADTAEMERLQAEWTYQSYGQPGAAGFEFLLRSRCLQEMVIARAVHCGTATSSPGSRYCWKQIGLTASMSDEEIISKTYQWFRTHVSYGQYTDSIRNGRISKEEEMVKQFIGYEDRQNDDLSHKIKNYLATTGGTSAKEMGGAAGTQCVELSRHYIDTCFGVKTTSLGNGNKVAKEAAKQYPKLFKLITTETPQSGDILSLVGTTAAYGHTAIVKGVNGKTVTLLEQWAGSGTVRENTYTIPGTGPRKFIAIARPIITTSSTTAKGAVAKAIKWAINTAKDNSVTYSQSNRLGPKSYDCSSFVYTAFKQAGYNLRQIGNTESMIADFTATGKFNAWSRSECASHGINLDTGKGLKAGDILLNSTKHVEIVQTDGGTRVGAHKHYADNPAKDITCDQPYHDYPWTHVIRPK